IIANTSMSGTIPSIISALSSLTYFDFSQTRLSGTIPRLTCGRAGSSCEIQQNTSSFFCRILCFDFSSRVFGRARCPKFPMSVVAQATGGWSEDSSSGSSSSGGQRYKAVSPLDARQEWFVVRRGNEELSTDFQKEVATLWTIRHTNLQRLLGYCWEQRGSALDPHSPAAIEGGVPLSVWQCLDVTAGVLRGLKHIQSHGVVHGRIHPRNILLDTALQPVLAGCMAVRMGDALPSIPTAAPAAAAAAAAASAGRVTRPPANHAYMDPILHASARTTPSTDVFSQLNSQSNARLFLPPLPVRTSLRPRLLTSPLSPIPPSPPASIAQLRAAHLPQAPDAIVLPMVRLALSCTASDPLSRPTVTDLLRSIKALKRSLSAHPRPALPGHAGTSGDGETAGAAGGGGPGGEDGGFSQNALDAKLDWLMEDEDSGVFVTDV
ncbi:unnamed protein product, partial [Closterium sp. Naga37s-1]